ncbi:unnamed protein product [Symbiodinium sp. CCMP2456]|nr:unnamed protein product [Symbiodinium sp. CCMP2456]
MHSFGLLDTLSFKPLHRVADVEPLGQKTELRESRAGYTEVDKLQPEGVKGRPKPPSQLLEGAGSEDEASSAEESSGSEQVATGTSERPPVHGPRNAPKSKRRRLALGGGSTAPSSGGDVVVDFF